MNFNLSEQYLDQFRYDLLTKFNYTPSSEIPSLDKIVVSMGVKDSNVQKHTLLLPFFILYLITGQKPVPTKAKKSIALYKLRKGMFSGLKVTLRNVSMELFLLNLLFIVLPKNKEFLKIILVKTLKNNMFSLGLPNVLLFPEIEKQVDNNKLKSVYGCNVTFVTTNSDFLISQFLLNLYGIPFIKN